MDESTVAKRKPKRNLVAMERPKACYGGCEELIFIRFINQAGMWVQLIALGKRPICLFFPPRQVGLALCSGEEQLEAQS